MRRAELRRPSLAGYRPRRRFRSPSPAGGPTLAVGASMKATFCVARGHDAFLSAHLGDLDSELAQRAFLADVELYQAMLDVRPEIVAHDLHPEYLSTKWALEQDAELVGVQHHHAHAAACLAEHGEMGLRSRSSSTARASGPTGRSGAGSSCAATSRASSGWRTSTRSRFRAARRRSGSRGESQRAASSGRACRCAGLAGARCARA